MKIKNGFILRKLGKEYMAVAVGEAGKSFNGVINLNEAGAWLWEQLREDTTREELMEKMCGYYDNLDKVTAEADLDEFLSNIEPALEK